MLQDYLWYVFNGFGDELTANFFGRPQRHYRTKKFKPSHAAIRRR